MSAADGGLRVQKAASNNPADVDAYPLTEHNPSITEPASVRGDTLTFDIGANLYGALREAVVMGAPTSSALEHFMKDDLADVEFRDGLRVRFTDSEYVSFGDWGEAERGNWLPDCLVEARDGWRNPPVETYWCEIKTGDASFERTQVAAMRGLSREKRVLKIRVLIDNLLDQYSVRIHEAELDSG